MSALIGTTLFLLLLIVAFATRNPVLLAVYSLVALVLVLTNVPMLSILAQRERGIVGLVVATLTLMLPIAALRNESAIAHYVTVLASFGTAYVLTRRPAVYLAASYWSLLAAQGAVIVYLAFTGLDDFPLENMLPDSSSNGVTSYLVLLQANYCIAHFARLGKTSLLTALVTLGICLVGFGRGSLLAAGALVAINLLFTPLAKTRGQAVIAGIVIIAAALGSLARFEEEIVDFVEVNTKIGSGLGDEPRERIIRDYLGRIDAWTLVVGADYRGTSIENDYFGNPHNSYIRAHHLFGLPYLLTMLAIPIALMRRGASSTVKIFGVSIGVVVLFRSFTEPILFPTLFDFYWFAMCFVFADPAHQRLARVAP